MPATLTKPEPVITGIQLQPWIGTNNHDLAVAAMHRAAMRQIETGASLTDTISAVTAARIYTLADVGHPPCTDAHDWQMRGERDHTDIDGQVTPMDKYNCRRCHIATEIPQNDIVPGLPDPDPRAPTAADIRIAKAAYHYHWR